MGNPGARMTGHRYGVRGPDADGDGAQTGTNASDLPGGRLPAARRPRRSSRRPPPRRRRPWPTRRSRRRPTAKELDARARCRRAPPRHRAPGDGGRHGRRHGRKGWAPQRAITTVDLRAMAARPRRRRPRRAIGELAVRRRRRGERGARRSTRASCRRTRRSGAVGLRVDARRRDRHQHVDPGAALVAGLAAEAAPHAPPRYKARSSRTRTPAGRRYDARGAGDVGATRPRSRSRSARCRTSRSRCGGAAVAALRGAGRALARAARAASTGNACGVAAVYQRALVACEAPTWRERVAAPLDAARRDAHRAAARSRSGACSSTIWAPPTRSTAASSRACARPRSCGSSTTRSA